MVNKRVNAQEDCGSPCPAQPPSLNNMTKGFETYFMEFLLWKKFKCQNLIVKCL